MWTQICRILKWIQISIMFFNSAINPKSACLTTHFLRGPNCNQPIAWNVYYTWSGRWAISTAVISFHLFGLKVNQFAPGNEFSSPHPIYIYSQLSDFMGWLSSLAQANLTSLSLGSDAVIFGGGPQGGLTWALNRPLSFISSMLSVVVFCPWSPPTWHKTGIQTDISQSPQCYKLEPPSSPHGFCRVAPSAGLSTRSAFEGTPVP